MTTEDLEERVFSVGNRPKKEDYSTFEEYDKAYLSFQKENMLSLAKKYPNAIGGGKLWTDAGMEPTEAFEKGLPDNDGFDFNLVNHQREKSISGKRITALRGSCSIAQVPAKLAGEGNYIFLIEPEDCGISISSALGQKRVDYSKGKLVGDIMPGEQEIVIGRRQPKERIVGARKVLEYSQGYDMFKLGPMIPNPNYRALKN
jgi:hypothetical protein